MYLFICTCLLLRARYKVAYISRQTVTYTDDIFCLWFKTQTCFCVCLLSCQIIFILLLMTCP